MALARTKLTSGSGGGSGTATTASVTLVANRLYLVSVKVSGTGSISPGTISVSGASATWASIRQHAPADSGANTRRQGIFRAQNGSGGSGTLTLSSANGTSFAWAVWEITGSQVDVAGNGAGAIRQDVGSVGNSTSCTTTLGALGSGTAALAQGATYSGTSTAEAGWTEVHDSAQLIGLWQSPVTDTTPLMTLSASQPWACLAVEIEPETTGALAATIDAVSVVAGALYGATGTGSVVLEPITTTADGWGPVASSTPATATARWLAEHDTAEVALVLWIEGVGWGYTTHPDVAGLRVAWHAATGGERGIELRGGLSLGGSIERRIELFRSKIDSTELSVSILDGEDDRLTAAMFAPARPMGRTQLLESVDATATVLHVGDASVGNAGTIYVGLETMRVTSFGLVSGLVYVERGKLALFSRGFGPEWGQRHDVPDPSLDEPLAAPEVTTSPSRWYNRKVGLYLCVRHSDGHWTAGFPGTATEDAELLWAGRIKHWSDPATGEVRLNCLEIAELLETTLGAHVFAGTVTSAPTYFAPELDQVRFTFEELRPQGTAVLGQPPPRSDVYAWPTYVGSLGLAGTYANYEDVRAGLLAAMADAFFAHGGTYAPSGTSMSITDSLGGTVAHRITTLLGATGRWVIRIYLSDAAWRLLGWWTQETQLPGTYVDGVPRFYLTLEQWDSDPQFYSADAPGLPRRYAVGGQALQRLEVSPSSAQAFARQTFIPPDVPDGSARWWYAVGYPTHGFLRLNDERIYAVHQVDAVTFLVLLEWTDQATVNRNLIESVDVDASAEVRVRQVWIEPYDRLADAVLSVLASTGTEGYDLPLYDRLPEGMGAAVPASLLDLSFLQALPKLAYTLTVLEPTPLPKLLTAALDAVAAQIIWRDGRLAIVQPFADTSLPASIDDTSRAQVLSEDGGADLSGERTVVEVNPATVINRATMQYAQDRAGTWRRTLTVNGLASQSDYAQVRGLVVTGYGLDQAGADYWVANVASALLAYYSEPIAVAERSFHFGLAAALVPGRQLLVDDLTIIDPATGARGVTGLRAWVLSSTIDWMTGVGRVQFVFAPHQQEEV